MGLLLGCFQEGSDCLEHLSGVAELFQVRFHLLLPRLDVLKGTGYFPLYF